MRIIFILWFIFAIIIVADTANCDIRYIQTSKNSTVLRFTAQPHTEIIHIYVNDVEVDYFNVSEGTHTYELGMPEGLKWCPNKKKLRDSCNESSLKASNAAGISPVSETAVLTSAPWLTRRKWEAQVIFGALNPLQWFRQERGF